MKQEGRNEVAWSIRLLGGPDYLLSGCAKRTGSEDCGKENIYRMLPVWLLDQKIPWHAHCRDWTICLEASCPKDRSPLHARKSGRPAPPLFAMPLATSSAADKNRALIFIAHTLSPTISHPERDLCETRLDSASPSRRDATTVAGG